MSTEYTKKINASLTEIDFDFVTKAADKDRRSTAQYASILLEDAIAAKRAEAQPKAQVKTNASA